MKNKTYTIKAAMSVGADWYVLRTKVTEEDLTAKVEEYKGYWRYVNYEEEL